MFRSLLLVPFAAATAFAASGLTAGQVIERIQKNVGVPWSAQTVDTFKTGKPDAQVTGIATTFAATFDVLKRAAASGKNLIITHEPTFYNHLDGTQEFGDDAVLKAKQEFIEKHGLVIWRFHDHWHMRRPDGVTEGVVRALGWQEQRKPGAGPALFNIPETTVDDLASSLKKRLKLGAVRVIGNPRMKVSHVGYSAGAPSSMSQINMLRRDDVQVLLIGESREWETIEYARDAAAQGRQKAVIILGHAASEEPGMEECARWLKTFVTEVPVEFIPAGEPYWQAK